MTDRQRRGCLGKANLGNKAYKKSADKSLKSIANALIAELLYGLHNTATQENN